MIFYPILLGAAASITSTPTDLVIDYKECVEAFAINQIRSGESAETLVSVGEVECGDKLPLIEAAYKQQVSKEVSAMPEAKDLAWSDVQRLVDEAVDGRMGEALAMARSAALRNIVFTKARINELEGANAQNR